MNDLYGLIEELRETGATASQMGIVTKIVACCLAAGPKPQPLTGTERSRLCRERKKEVCNDATLHVAQDTVDNNIINNNKKNNHTTPATPAVARKATRIPEDWNPSENLWTWGKEKLPEAELRFETAAFKDFWAAKPGAAGTKLDWDKTWKTWVREAVRRRSRFKPKDNVLSFVSSGPKRTWREQQDAKEGKS